MSDNVPVVPTPARTYIPGWTVLRMGHGGTACVTRELDRMEERLRAMGYEWSYYSIKQEFLVRFGNLRLNGKRCDIGLDMVPLYKQTHWPLEDQPDPHAYSTRFGFKRAVRSEARKLGHNEPMPSLFEAVVQSHVRAVNFPPALYEVWLQAELSQERVKYVLGSNLVADGLLECAAEVAMAASYINDRLWNIVDLSPHWPVDPAFYASLEDLASALESRTLDLHQHFNEARDQRAHLDFNQDADQSGDAAMRAFLEASKKAEVRALEFLNASPKVLTSSGDPLE